MSTDTEGHDPKEEGAGFGPDAPEATTDSNNSGTGAETHLPVSPLDIAHDCLVRGFSPVPVPYKGKNPGRKGWHTLVITADNVGKYFNGARMNVGVQLGPKSNYLTDVDCDSPEAVKLAPYFLPGTDAVFGRKSKPDSHSLYVIKDAPAVGVIKFADPDGKCIIELRLGGDKKGIQTIFPGSVHQSGELIEWTKNGTPVEVPFKQMERIVRSIAIASMVLRHWPKESGSRHDLALCLGGLLVRCGFKSDDIPRFIEIVARAAGDSEFLDRGKAAASSVETFLKNGKTYGRPKLIELLGEKASSIIELLPRADLQIVGVQLDDFRAYMPMHNYVYMPTREPWPAASVNARLGLVTVEGAFDEKGNPVKIPASTWLDQKPVG